VHLALAIVLALASALAFAASTVGQQRAAARSSDADARGGRFMVRLLRDPQWLAATLGNAAGYILQGAALGLGSVIVVQPILVTSLLFALPLSARLAHRRLPLAAVRSGLVLTVSLSVFEILGEADNGATHGSSLGWLIVTAIGLPVVAACVLFAHPRYGAVRAGLLAIAVGVLGGVLAVLTKTVVDTGAHGLVHLLSTGETYGLIAVGVSGIYLQQLSFQAGALQTSLPIMTVLEPMIAVVLGLTLLHEQVEPGAIRLAVLLASALFASVATVALARIQAEALATPPATGSGLSADAPVQ
jgi:hypothetical protein